MSLSDKFNILIQAPIPVDVIDKKEDESIMYSNSFFENLIKNDQKICVGRWLLNYIKDISHFELERILRNNLNDYIKDLRKNLRSNVKRNQSINLIEKFEFLINKFKDKVNTLSYYISSTDFNKKCYFDFLSKIISDPMIQNIFSRDTLELKNKFKFRKLLKSIENTDINYYTSWCVPYLKNSIDAAVTKSFVFENIEQFQFNIPKNILEIYNFKSNLNFLNAYLKHFDYFEDKVGIFENVIKNTLEILERIIKLNNFDTIIKLFNNVNVEKGLNNVLKNIDSNNISNLLDDFSIKLTFEIITKFKTNNSFSHLFDFYSTLSKSYKKIETTILCKEISKIISQKNLYDDFNEKLMINLSKKEDNLLIYLFNIINYLDNKVIIFKKYHRNLILRLLNNCESKGTSDPLTIQLETTRVTKLGSCFSTSQRYKLKKTISDISSSNNINDTVKSIILNRTDICPSNYVPDNFNIITTSYNTWDTPILETNAVQLNSIRPNRPLARLLKLYSEAYERCFDDKKYLNWYLHTGFVNLRYLNNVNGNYIMLKLLPIQALILEKFDEDYIFYSEFLQFDFLNSYDKVEKEKLIDTFIENKILILISDKLSLNLEIDIPEEINLIDKYFEKSLLPDVWNNIEEIELANEKIDILKCKINHYLKVRAYDYNELFQTCRGDTYFAIEESMFDKAMEYMEIRDYIKIGADGICKKLLY